MTNDDPLLKVDHEVAIDPTEIVSVGIRVGNYLLLVRHDLDEHKRGFFRIRLVGFDNSGVLITKEFTPGKFDAAFFGELSVAGPADADLWSSFGFQDMDQVDSEGNVTNKPRELRVHPKRDD